MIRSVLAPNPGPYTLDGTRTWLVGESVMIDPGPAIASHIEALCAAQPGVNTILVTHRHADHAPAAVEVARRTGAAILAPTGVLHDAVVTRRVSDGMTIETDRISIETISTPGHTAEHVCYLTSDGALFTGDTILGEGTTTIFPPDGSMADYMASLRKLRARAPGRIFPGHGPVREDPVAWIDYYIAHRLEREQQILASLESGPKTIPELRSAIYPALHPALAAAAEMQLCAHAEHLVSKGAVRVNGGLLTRT